MTDTAPRNNLTWRVTVLEREMRSLIDAKPDVVAERVTRLSADIESLRREAHDDTEALRSEMATQRRILVGAFISIAVGLIVAIAMGGTPIS